MNKLDENAIIDIVVDLIKPISYVSFDNKMKLIDKTIEDSKGAKYPTAERYKNFVVNLIATYTNLEMTSKDYDALSECKLLNIVLSTFESEYVTCSKLIQLCLQDLESR